MPTNDDQASDEDAAINGQIVAQRPVLILIVAASH